MNRRDTPRNLIEAVKSTILNGVSSERVEEIINLDAYLENQVDQMTLYELLRAISCELENASQWSKE